MRAAIYARYSSDNQRDASIEDQVRVCSERIKREKWKLAATYSDRALSGASTLRPGYQKLLQDVRAGQIDIVIAEALDRISRDQEHIAAFFKQLMFAGARLFTLADGEISELHVGLKGTMNALFLKDLAQKTHRGLEGKVRAGMSAGGRAYGYDIERKLEGGTDLVAGLRKINKTEAAVVRRIFKMFAAGTSPRAIAAVLNKEKVSGPGNRPWCDTTIRGHGGRRTGILRNDLYNGELVWNKQKYIKDPQTGKRLARINPEQEWIRQALPELRIVEAGIWSRVQNRLGEITASGRVVKAKATKFWEKRRAKHLLTGLAVCGACGAPLCGVGKDYLSCSSARRFGTCGSRSSIRRSILEEAVLGVLRDDLLKPDLVEEFVRTYHEEINQQAALASADRSTAEREVTKVKKQIDTIIESIMDGFRSEGLKVKLADLEERRRELEHNLTAPKPTTLRLHPRLSELYREKVQRLAQSLSEPDDRDGATELLRQLIEGVRVTSKGNGWEVEIKSEVGRMANLAEGKTERNQCSVKVVAGAGFEPTTFRL